jgi:FKBP-type peptidyl-prolyl cis-trans isomerase
MKSLRVPGTFSGMLLVLAFAPPVSAATGTSRAGLKPNAAAAPEAITNILVSFKLDPRLSGPTYGGDRWISPITYTGANGQDTIEARAHAIATNGAPTKLSIRWIPSDKELVTVAPGRDDQVKITVHRAGQSKIKLAAQGVSRELLVEGKLSGAYMLVTIKQLPVERPAAEGNLARGTFLAEKEALKAAEEQRARKESIARRQQQSLANFKQKQIEAFRSENSRKAGVVTLPSGLQYKVVKAGKGEKPTDADAVQCHYRMTTVQGTEIQSSYPLGQPVTLAVATATPSWREALKLMPVGSKWQLFVPPAAGSEEKRPPGRHRRRSSKPSLVFNQPAVVELELLAIAGRPSSAGKTTAATVIPSVKGK